MENNLICPRCGCDDPSWFYHGSKGWYCRRCITFGRALIEEEDVTALVSVNEGSAEYTLQFPLTPAQKQISEAAAYASRYMDVLLECPCGAGKTEMVLGSIHLGLKQGKRVCFAIARRQVVLEVAQRLQGYFHHARVTAICGGHTDCLEGDLIVCTTHQLYRFTEKGKQFDLLILDEPDAFPFAGDPVLHAIAAHACCGHVIYLTATPDQELKKRVEDHSLLKLSLMERPHHHPLPVPEIKVAPLPLLLILLIRWIKRFDQKPRMVFVPTIAMASGLHSFLSLFEKCLVCTSKTENRDEVIENYRGQPHGLIVATTVLERGVTIPHAQICVFMADHSVFDEAGLIQMAGRAGRSFDDPDGNVLFLCQEKSRRTDQCRDTLIGVNHAVSLVCVQ